MQKKQTLKRLTLFLLLFIAIIIPELDANASDKLLTGNQLGSDIVSYYDNNPEYFDFDLQKYRMSSSDKVGTSIKTGLPIGIGVALFTIMGNPIAAVPITMGVVTGSMAIRKFIQNRDTKRLLKGAYLYLQPDYASRLKKPKKYQSYFEKFYKRSKKFLDSPEKKQVALELLYINHYAPLIAKRLRSDPELATYKNFYKKNKIPQDGSWNRKFMENYYVILKKSLIDAAKSKSFLQLNEVTYGILPN